MSAVESHGSRFASTAARFGGLVVVWLGATILALAAFFEASLTRCDNAPAVREPGNGFCDFVHPGGDYAMLLAPQAIMLVGVVATIARRSWAPAIASVVVALLVAGGEYVWSEFLA